MNAKITNAIKNTKGFLCKHSPEILTGIGVASMVGSTILAVKATPKALQLIEEAKNRQNRDLVKEAAENGYDTCNQISSLKPLEAIKVAWKPYIPSMALGVSGIACIIGASTVNVKRNAALATAYALSERTLITYRDKVIETIGEKKEKEIREKISQDRVNEQPVSKSQVIVTSKGNTLCMDSISGRYFRSDIDKIRKVVNELNREMRNQNYVSLNEFYSQIGLEPIKNGYQLGWNIDRGFIDVEFGSCLADDEPCVVIDYSIEPNYDYDRLY